MSRRASSSISIRNSEALEAAAHPGGPLRGLQARRAFTHIVEMQSVCRGSIARAKFVLPSRPPRPTPMPTPTPTVALVSPSTPSKMDPSLSMTALPPPEPIRLPNLPDGPEHALVYLAIELKTTSKDISSMHTRMTELSAEIAFHSSRVASQQAIADEIQRKQGDDCVPITRLERLQAEIDESNRELDGWIAQEAARKGRLIQLRAQVQAKAKLQAQWHRKRTSLEHAQEHFPYDAEQMFKESIVRAALYVAVACREKVAKPQSLPRESDGKTRVVRLNRSRRSPLAPPPKPAPSTRPRTRGRGDVPRPSTSTSKRSGGAPPSAFGQNGDALGVPRSSDDSEHVAAAPVPRRVSVEASEQDRKMLNARLADFYAPRPRSSSVVASGPVVNVVASPSDETPAPPSAAALFEEISSSILGLGPSEAKLDLNLSIPTIPKAKRASSTPPSAFLSKSTSEKRDPSPSPYRPFDSKSSSTLPAPAVEAPRVSMLDRPRAVPMVPIRRRLSKRNVRHSMPPAPTSSGVTTISAPAIAPLAISSTTRTDSLLPVLADTTEQPNASSSLLAALYLPPAPTDFRHSSSPFAQSSPPSTMLAADPTSAPAGQTRFSQRDVAVPDWLNELITPLQQANGPAPKPLALDLHIPAPTPAPKPSPSKKHTRPAPLPPVLPPVTISPSPPASASARDEWDVVSTSPFADRDSFHIASSSPVLDTHPPPPSSPRGRKSGLLRRPVSGQFFFSHSSSSSTPPSPAPSKDVFGGEGAGNPRVAKLRNRASYILPKVRGGSTKSAVALHLGPDDHDEETTPSRPPISVGIASFLRGSVNGKESGHEEKEGGEVPSGGREGKWRRRLSISSVFPLRPTPSDGHGTGEDAAPAIPARSPARAKRSSGLFSR